LDYRNNYKNIHIHVKSCFADIEEFATNLKNKKGRTGTDIHVSITGCRRTLSSCKSEYGGYVRPKIMSRAKSREIVVLKNN